MSARELKPKGVGSLQAYCHACETPVVQIAFDFGSVAICFGCCEKAARKVSEGADDR